mmetsp:Transcript_34769/g.107582  ORF Transcript_34769/g.107582 Transcript_34769/m.107582 type:complete len:373 (+) Transcript_34769:195-1313(+)
MKPLTPAERATFAALIEALMPPLTEEETEALADPAWPAARRIALAESAARPASIDAVERCLGRVLPEERLELRIALAALDTSLGAAALCGLPLKPFSKRTLAERDAALRGMASSALGVRRKAFHALKRLCLRCAADGADAPIKRASGWRPPPPSLFGPPPPPTASVDLPEVDPTKGRWDVVVVGSGCGGGVVAETLCDAGLRVLVLEKAAPLPSQECDGDEGKGFDRLYERCGLVATADGSLGVLAADAVGGGSAINWACSLRTPRKVLDEWRRDHGLAWCAEGGAMDAALDWAEAKLEVLRGDAVTHNFANAALLEGAKATGLGARVAPQAFRRTDETAWYASRSAGTTRSRRSPRRGRRVDHPKRRRSDF